MRLNHSSETFRFEFKQALLFYHFICICQKMSENVSTVIDSLTCYTELTMEQQRWRVSIFCEWNRDVLFAQLDNCRAEQVTLLFDVCKQSNDIEKENREHRSLDEVTFAEYECSIVPNLICLLGISICPPTQSHSYGRCNNRQKKRSIIRIQTIRFHRYFLEYIFDNHSYRCSLIHIYICNEQRKRMMPLGD